MSDKTTRGNPVDESRNNNSEEHQHREFSERESKVLGSIFGRIGTLESGWASTSSDLRNLSDAVKSISSKLDSMDIRNRPNTLAIFGAAVSLVSLIAVIGVLAFAPVYRTIGQMSQDGRHMQTAIEGIISTRFTPDDARYIKETHDRDIGVVTRSLSGRMDKHQSLLIDVISRTSRLEGSVYQPHRPVP